MSTPFRAFTIYARPIVGASFVSRAEALQWAANHGPRWPESRIVQQCADGRERTIWKWQPEAEAA